MKKEYIEVSEFTGEGYQPVVDYESWRVAILNYIDELEIQNIDNIQKHDESDEVFVLLRGDIMLFTGGKGQNPGKFDAIALEPYKMYNVKKGVWHTHTVSKDAMVLIVENVDTCDDNSPKVYLDQEQKDRLKELFSESFADVDAFYGRK